MVLNVYAPVFLVQISVKGANYNEIHQYWLNSQWMDLLWCIKAVMRLPIDVIHISKEWIRIILEIEVDFISANNDDEVGAFSW